MTATARAARISIIVAAASLVARPAAAITSCSVVAASGVAFGGYDVFDTSPVDSMGSVSVLCRGVGPTDQITIDLGRGGAGGFDARALTSGAASLLYNLFVDASRMTVWGDGSGGTSHYGPAVPPDGSTLTVPIYGRLPARQNVPAGSYGDTITITVNY